MLEVITGADISPRRTIIHGPGGIGKTTWAANAPNPIFVQTEEGRTTAARLPLCRTLEDIKKALRLVLMEEHDYKTLVFDTADKAQPMIFASVCANKGLSRDKDITDIGYNKGYEAAVTDWQKICFVLDKIRVIRNMHIIIIAHSKVERFEDPSTEAYDRYQMALHKLSAAELVGWADEVLFANYKTYTRKDGEGFEERRIGIGAGERTVYTTARPSHIAKNRLGLPEELPLDYAALAAYYTTPAGDGGPPSTTTHGLGEPAQSPAVNNSGGGQGGNSAAVAAVGGPSDAATPPPEMTALGFTELDLEDMDAVGLRECALLVADKMSVKSKAAFKSAFAKSDLAKMRGLIERAMNKPDVSGILED